jgi:hypothetical protein
MDRKQTQRMTRQQQSCFARRLKHKPLQMFSCMVTCDYLEYEEMVENMIS